MKVLALAVLIIAISGLEAGIVKREVPNIQQVTDFFQGLFDSLKASTGEFAEKFNTAQIQAQAEQLLEQAKEQTMPLTEHFQSIVKKVLEASKQ